MNHYVPKIQIKLLKHIKIFYPSKWKNNNLPYTQSIYIKYSLSTEWINNLAKLIYSYHNVLVVIGELHGKDQIYSIYSMIANLGIPVYCDILSSLKHTHRKNKVWNLNIFLEYNNHIDCIIHIGGKILSKKFLQFCEQRNFQEYIHISSFCSRLDPTYSITKFIHVDLVEFCTSFSAACLKYHKNTSMPQVKDSNLKYLSIIKQILKEEKMNSFHISMYLLQNISYGTALFLGNSLSIRIFESICLIRRKNPLFVSANRGASGIDGNIASAIGFSNAVENPVILIIGDQSFYMI